jgi:hypothetical protein
LLFQGVFSESVKKMPVSVVEAAEMRPLAVRMAASSARAGDVPAIAEIGFSTGIQLLGGPPQLPGAPPQLQVGGWMAA